MSGYDSGWNDTEYGINNWTSGSKWETPLQWALEMLDIAQDEKAKSTNPYYDGVIAAVKKFQKEGVIHRRG